MAGQAFRIVDPHDPILFLAGMSHFQTFQSFRVFRRFPLLIGFFVAFTALGGTDAERVARRVLQQQLIREVASPSVRDLLLKVLHQRSHVRIVL